MEARWFYLICVKRMCIILESVANDCTLLASTRSESSASRFQDILYPLCRNYRQVKYLFTIVVQRERESDGSC